jgi:hypothetical protein
MPLAIAGELVLVATATSAGERKGLRYWRYRHDKVRTISLCHDV